jgi:hypothetical protein
MSAATLSDEAIAQARYALFEKLIKAKSSLVTAREVFPDNSDNVRFWGSEVNRVWAALQEFGGRP